MWMFQTIQGRRWNKLKGYNWYFGADTPKCSGWYGRERGPNDRAMCESKYLSSPGRPSSKCRVHLHHPRHISHIHTAPGVLRIPINLRVTSWPRLLWSEAAVNSIYWQIYVVATCEKSNFSLRITWLEIEWSEILQSWDICSLASFEASNSRLQ